MYRVNYSVPVIYDVHNKYHMFDIIGKHTRGRSRISGKGVHMYKGVDFIFIGYLASSPMGNHLSPGRHHNLQCSKAVSFKFETVIRNKFKNFRYYASSGYLQVLKGIE